MINSWLKKGFGRNDELKEENELRHKVHQEILKRFRSIPSFDKGLAIYTKFSKDKDGDIDVNIANLNHEPVDDVFVGKVYNIDQLLWIYNLNRELLIINVDEKEFDVYHLIGEKLEKLKTFENVFKETTKKEYQQMFTPVEGASKIVYGKGERKTERRLNRSLKHFFDWSFNNLLDEDFFKEFDLKYLFLFHTSKFDDISKDMKDLIKQKIKLETIFISRINTESVNLKKKVVEEIDSIKKKKKIKLLENVKSVPERYAKGWKEVTDAARFGKIDTLFLKPKVRKKGYLTSRDMIYTYPEKGSMMVDNIEPWLVMDTYNKSGEIRIVNREDDVFKSNILALLRY
jgi:hypothetical protein